MTSDTWSQDDAERRFGEEDYDRLAPVDMVEFPRASPPADALAAGELTLERSREVPRDIAL